MISSICMPDFNSSHVAQSFIDLSAFHLIPAEKKPARGRGRGRIAGRGDGRGRGESGQARGRPSFLPQSAESARLPLPLLCKALQTLHCAPMP